MTETKPRKINLIDEEVDDMYKIKEEHAISTNQTWESFHLADELTEGIYGIGFEKPSFIQKKAIPVIVEGKCLRAQAQSGTGKTGAFVIGSLQRIDPALKETQCLVLTSTREIAAQIHTVYKTIGKKMNVEVGLLIGQPGVGMGQNDKAMLQKRPHIVVGTPGKVGNMIENKAFDVSSIRMFILDEADEMLTIGFMDQVRSIYESLNLGNIQSLFFSATYDTEILDVIKNIVEDPVEIDLRTDDLTLAGIKQYHVNIGKGADRRNSREHDEELQAKVNTFIDLYKNQSVAQVLIFINTKKDAQNVVTLLNAKGYPCGLLSGNLTTEERSVALEDFKKGNERILVTTGLGKRGIDIQSLSLVVCLDVTPFDQKSDFIHRVGRAGRYGRKGFVLHILTSQEVDELNKISKHFNCVIPPLPQGQSFNQ